MRRCIALLASACLLTGLAVVGADRAPAEAAAKQVSARALLAKLPVRAEDHAHRYVRDRFAYGSDSDADGDGCSTRKEVLIREAVRLDKVSKSCAVYGRWKSLYDDRVTDSPYGLEVDHVVPLAEAWHSGAYAWSHRKQVAYGNDLGYRWSLLPVTAALNQGTNGGKGSQDPASWLPPKNRCTYAKAWIGVKSRWKLPVDPAEKAALGRALNGCASLAVLKPGTPDIGALAGRIAR